jgi:hypothetical protein
MADVELYRSGPASVANCGDTITIRVGSETRSMSVGEWARLIVAPQRGPHIEFPGGIDDMGLG